MSIDYIEYDTSGVLLHTHQYEVSLESILLIELLFMNFLKHYTMKLTGTEIHLYMNNCYQETKTKIYIQKLLTNNEYYNQFNIQSSKTLCYHHW